MINHEVLKFNPEVSNKKIEGQWSKDKVEGLTEYGWIDYVYNFNLKDKEGDEYVGATIGINHGKVVTVSGNEGGGNLSFDLLDVVHDKCKELPGGEKFDEKYRDMKQLSIIRDKVSNKEDLTEDEIIFIYQLRGQMKIYGDPGLIASGDQRNNIIRRLNKEECFSRIKKKENLALLNAYKFAMKLRTNESVGEEEENNYWKSITENGDSDVVHWMFYSVAMLDPSKDKEMMEKIWNLTKEKADTNFVNGLIEGRSGRHSIVGDINEKFKEIGHNVWDVIREKADNKTILNLSRAMRFNYVPAGIDREQVLDFIIEKGGKKEIMRAIRGYAYYEHKTVLSVFLSKSKELVERAKKKKIKS